MTEERPRRRLPALLAGPLAALLVWLLLRSLPEPQPAVAAVFSLAVAWWVTEALPLPLTALVATALLVLVAGLDERDAFGAFGDPIILLFVGSFILARAMELTRLGQRLAWHLLARTWATGTPSRLVFALGAVACALSLVLSNTATTAMLLPIGLGVLGALRCDERGTPLPLAVLLMLTWGSSVAVGVPVGTPPNLIALSLLQDVAGVRIGFLQWAAFAMPLTVIMLLVAWGLLTRMYPSGTNVGPLDGEAAREALGRLGPLSEAERSTLLAFGVTLALWMAPDLAALAWGPDAAAAQWIASRLTLAVGAIAGALLLFVLPMGSEAAFGWRRLAAIDWGTILLFGGGIALGRAMDASGLAASIGRLAVDLVGADTLWSITALAIAAAIALSEIASNTASASILLPVTIGIAEAAGVSPVPPAIGVALGASLGFMMPVSTPPNAIVYGTGLVPAREMMRAGLLLDVLGFLATFACLRLLLPLAGLV